MKALLSKLDFGRLLELLSRAEQDKLDRDYTSMHASLGEAFELVRELQKGLKEAEQRCLLPANAGFLDAALLSGAKLTGTPDGMEPIEVHFTVSAWQKFSAVCETFGGK